MQRPVTNRMRAKWAHLALAEFVRVTRDDPQDGDLEEKAANLICDLMHLLAETGHDPWGTVSRALRHFDEEVGDK